MNDLATPIITELCPKPSNGSEWVELYNPSEESVNLTQWQVWDQLSQPSLLYSFTDFSLAPHTFVVVEVGKKLNDTGDGVTILDAEKNVVDSVSYQTAQPDLSYTRTDLNPSSGFEWQPISPNAFTTPVITPTSTTFPTSFFTPTPSIEFNPSPTAVIPTRTPAPSKAPTPTKTPTPAKILNPTNEPEVTNTPPPISISPIPTNQLVPPFSPPKPPSLQLKLNTSESASQSASLSSSINQHAPTHSPSRFVYFPLSANPLAAQNVIIGGCIICFQAGITVWQDWKNQHQDTYF